MHTDTALVSELGRRHRQVQNLLEAAGLDGLLSYTGRWRKDDLVYLAGQEWPYERALLALGQTAPPFIFSERQTAIDDSYPGPIQEQIVESLLEAVSNLNIPRPDRWAVAGLNYLPLSIGSALRAAGFQ